MSVATYDVNKDVSQVARDVAGQRPMNQRGHLVVDALPHRKPVQLAKHLTYRSTSARRSTTQHLQSVDRLAMCLADMEAWLKANRLCLNPTKTQVMWLGSQQLLARLDIADMPVLSSTIRI